MYSLNGRFIYKVMINVILVMSICACSTMGKVAKVSFISVKEIYAVQPESIRTNYPDWMKRTFFTSELLTTDYEKWRVRLHSKANLEQYFLNNKTFTELEYELNFETHRMTVELLFEQKIEVLQDNEQYYAYDFSFSNSGKTLWEDYQYHFYEMEKPWFNYPVSPELPANIKREIESILYNYAPNWGYLSLREFMELFELNTERRWEDFCFWNNYQYDDSSVCGDIRIEDDFDVMQGANN